MIHTEMINFLMYEYVRFTQSHQQKTSAEKLPTSFKIVNGLPLKRKKNHSNSHQNVME